MNQIINDKINLITKHDDVSFVIINNEQIIHSSKGIGVKPILQLIKSNPNLINDNVVIDKIIGRAAAILLCKYKPKKVYGILMSKSAIEIFLHYKIEYGYNNLVENILNRTSNGLCPLEESVVGVFNLNDGEKLIINKVNDLMLKQQK